ncbi:MAG: hypothetical protein MUE85_12560 [Microscillaceae bacterium]|nr:hypothetical protein [Microscillaceae bacterium]
MKINQKPSAKIAKVKLLIILPICIFSTFITACSRERTLEMISHTNSSKNYIPDGYEILQVYHFDSQNTKVVKFDFTKDVDYFFQIIDDKTKRGLMANFQMKWLDKANNELKLALKGENYTSKELNIHFACKKTGIYQFEISPNQSVSTITIKLFARPRIDVEAININSRENMGRLIGSKIIKKITLINQNIEQLMLEAGQNYYLVLNNATSEAMKTVKFSLYDVENKLLASNHLLDKEQPAIAFKCTKSGNYKLKYWVNDSSKIYQLELFAKSF